MEVPVGTRLPRTKYFIRSTVQVRAAVGRKINSSRGGGDRLPFLWSLAGKKPPAQPPLSLDTVCFMPSQSPRHTTDMDDFAAGRSQWTIGREGIDRAGSGLTTAHLREKGVWFVGFLRAEASSKYGRPFPLVGTHSARDGQRDHRERESKSDCKQFSDRRRQAGRQAVLLLSKQNGRGANTEKKPFSAAAKLGPKVAAGTLYPAHGLKKSV